jgi:5-methylthioadenosine/S-adenosylhomocysteine deaminase
VGKKADVTLLDIRRPEWQPIINPVANLVYSAHGGCADTLIVDGKILMRGGKVLTLNEDDLYEEAADRAMSLAKRTGLAEIAASIWPMS